MSEALETVIEEDPKNDNEEAPEKVEEVKPEEIKKEEPKEEQKEAPKEDEQFKNKTDRMKNKKVKCEVCQAEMTLKTLRYSHKCNGKTEDKPIKPKPKTRAVAVKPIENQVIKSIPPTKVKEPTVQYSEPIEVKTKSKPVDGSFEPSSAGNFVKFPPVDDVLTSSSAGNARASPPVVMKEPEPPPRQLTAREILEASYNEIRKAKREAQIEKINSFRSKMF